MGTGRRIAIIALSTLAIVLFLVFVAALLVTNTDWGREQARRIALLELEGAMDGEISVGSIRGNLLRGVRLVDVSIADASGRPFVRADTIESRYSLRALLSRQIRLSDVRLVNAQVVLDRPPGEDWNFVRIFAGEPDPDPARDPSPWGRIVELRDVELVNSRITIRTEWKPPRDLSPAEQQEAIRLALSDRSRENVFEVERGYQTIMDYRQLNAQIPRVLVAHPDTMAIPVDIERFSGIAQPFKPPVAVVRHLSGRFRLQGDTLYFHDADAWLQDSRMAGDGFYAMEHSDLSLRLEGSSVSLADLRWLYPPLPEEGGGSLHLELRMRPFQQRIVAREVDLRVRDSEVTGNLDLQFGEVFRIQDTRLRFSGLDSRLVESMVPDLEIPRHGRVDGYLAVDGTADAMQVEADLAFDEYGGVASRIQADGGISTGGDLVFRDLRLQLQPLQVDLVRTAVPGLPVGGTLHGTLVANGTLDSGLDLELALVHAGAGERSVVRGRADVALNQDRFNADVRLEPLSLATAGRFVPGAGLHGAVTGSLRLSGTLSAFRLETDLRLHDGGLLRAAGIFDLAGPEPAYDLDMALSEFDLEAVTRNAPAATSLSGVIHVEGRGTDPGSMQASLRADLTGIAVDEYAADEVLLRLTADAGTLHVRPARIRLGSAEAEIEGHIGLSPTASGRLEYRVAVDSIETFEPLLASADTAAVYVQTDHSLQGRVEAAGTVTGNVERFDLEGRVDLDRVSYEGNYVERGVIEYVLAEVGTEHLNVRVEASLDTAKVAGFDIRAAAVRGTYAGGRIGAGELDVRIERDAQMDLNLGAKFELAEEQNALQLREFELRLDTLTWRTTGPSAVNWGGLGVEVLGFELQSEEGGRVFIDGRLPVEGPADLNVAVENLQIAPILGLLQAEQDLSGLLTLEARVSGTAEQLQLDGDASLVSVNYAGGRVPDAQISFEYATDELRAAAILRHDGAEVAVADARIPLHLAARGEGIGLLDRPMRVEVRADELPIDILPALTDQVETAEGEVSLDISITGMIDAPVVEGDVTLHVESLEVVPLGVRFAPIVGHARVAGGILQLDSLIAWSEGPTRVTGTVSFESLTRPEVDLVVDASEAWVIDTDDARLQVSADLTVTGPLDALEVTGLVRTRKGVIYVPESSEFGDIRVVNLDDPALFERVDTVLLARREVVVERSPVTENLNLDVEVLIDRDVWLRSTEANIEIYTPEEVGPLRVRATGLQQVPSIEGTINTDRGEYEYLSRRFTLTRGAVSFLGGEEIDPLLQIAAEHEVRMSGREALIIRIVLGGTLTDLEITLESNAQPPIPQSDLLSYLAFGREASSLLPGQGSISGQGASGGGLVGNMAGLATQQFTAFALDAMIDGLEANLGRELGLDVLRITPAPMPADLFTGGYLDILRGTEIEAGRYVIPRVFVAGQVRPTFAVPGVHVEYRTRGGFEWSSSWRQRFVPVVPTLREPDVDRVGVFGSFLFKEWRF